MFSVPWHVSDLSSFPPPAMLIFHWNPGCLHTAFSTRSFLGTRVVCCVFCPVTPPHLMRTIHVQPCLLIRSAKWEPLQPPHGQHHLASHFLHRFLNPSEVEDILPPSHPSPSPPPRPLPPTLQTSPVLWARRCIVSVLFSHNLQRVSREWYLLHVCRLYLNPESRISFFIDMES